MNTIHTLRKMKAIGEKIAMLTCYDASFAAIMNTAGVDVLLVGDSLGMVLQGQDSTLPVTLADMQYHTRMVARGNQRALVVADLPFGTYRDKEQAFDAAAVLMAAGAHMVKMEGGAWLAETTRFLQQRGIPVCVHLGLTPQSVNTLGGYRVQGRGDAAIQLLQDAQAHDQAGAEMIVLECVPRELARSVTASVSCPVIGIGAGVDCDGQVLVVYDMLGIFPGKSTKFVRNFMTDQTSIAGAIKAYVAAVKTQSFPTNENSFE